MTTATKCPRCGTELGGLATYCYACDEYVADMADTTSATPPARTAELLPDDRLEEQIQHATKVALERLGFTVHDLSQGRKTRQTPGLADLYVVGHGVCVWAEMKRRGERQSAAQIRFETDVLANGGRYVVWHHENEAIEWARGVVQ